MAEMSIGMQIMYGMIREEINKAMAMTSFNINTDAALYKKADKLGLGEMKTDEVYVKTSTTEYVAQGYTDGILYTEKGKWDMDDIKLMPWKDETMDAAKSAAKSAVGEASSMSSEAMQAAKDMADEIRSSLGGGSSSAASSLGEAASSLGAKASDSLGSLTELGGESGTTLRS